MSIDDSSHLVESIHNHIPHIRANNTQYCSMAGNSKDSVCILNITTVSQCSYKKILQKINKNYVKSISAYEIKSKLVSRQKVFKMLGLKENYK